MAKKFRIEPNYNLRPNKDGYYRPSFVYEGDGKPHSVRDRDLIKAYLKLNELYDKLEAGEVITNRNTTVARWAEEFLEIYIKPRYIKEDGHTTKEYLNQKGLVYRHILPVIGTIRIKHVTEADCQRVINTAAAGRDGEKGLGLSRLKKLRMMLFNLFRRAVKSKLRNDNPAEDLTLPNLKEGKYRPITDYERSMITELSKEHPAGPWVMTLLYCGIRPGESVPLVKVNFDMQSRRLAVRAALESGSKDIFKSPKSEAGYRFVPIPEILVPFIQPVLDQCGPFDFVFTQPTTGNHHTTSSLRCLWNSFKRALDIKMGAQVYRNQIVKSVVAEDLVPYCLRHTYGTDLQDAGVPLNVAKVFMGHADVSTTGNIYTDITEAAIEEAASKINSRPHKVLTEATA